MKTTLPVMFVAATLLTGIGVATRAALAQEKPTTPDNLHYDIYQPSERLRTRRENCLADEDMRGAYCVKKCDKDYIAVGSGHPPRCRSVEPLPPGRMPTAIRIQTATQPLPPPSNKPPVTASDPRNERN